MIAAFFRRQKASPDLLRRMRIVSLLIPIITSDVSKLFQAADVVTHETTNQKIRKDDGTCLRAAAAADFKVGLAACDFFVPS